MTEITVDTIKAGLETKVSWVHRGVCALADHPDMGVMDRRKFQDFKDDLRALGEIEQIDVARQLCLKYANLLLKVATGPAYDFRRKSFVLTGKLQNFTRNELSTKLEGFGAYVANSVTRSTDVVIVGNKPGIKFRTAKMLNTTLWTEDELIENMKPASKK
jgi:NAD-dependent DNA ligase